MRPVRVPLMRRVDTTVPGPVLPADALAGAVVLAVLFAAVYHRTLGTLARLWRENEDYSHGPLVPLVTVALIWALRDRLWRTTSRPDTRGLVLVALACAMLVAGIRADIFALQGWSIPVMLFGLSLTFLGAPITAQLAFPLGFVVFMLTFPPFLVNGVSFQLKRAAVGLAAEAARWAGAHVLREGMTFYFASGSLRIEHPCSGLRSLLALVAFSSLLAYLTPGPAARRVLLAAAAVPVAIAANAFRLFVLIVCADAVGVQTASGPVHDAAGYLLYAVAIAALFAVRAGLFPASPAPRLALHRRTS